jgi:hypothetical protein
METKNPFKRILGIIIAIVILVCVFWSYYRYYYVFGDGVKAGSMNYFVHKGYVFKTYEGRLIQSGLRIQPNGGGGMQSNEFQFSVTDQKVADQLNKSAGAYVELHYKEYLHALPWRGVSEFVVDSVVLVRQINPIIP